MQIKHGSEIGKQQWVLGIIRLAHLDSVRTCIVVKPVKMKYSVQTTSKVRRMNTLEDVPVSEPTIGFKEFVKKLLFGKPFASTQLLPTSENRKECLQERLPRLLWKHGKPIIFFQIWLRLMVVFRQTTQWYIDSYIDFVEKKLIP